jgi:hypothetical protein
MAGTLSSGNGLGVEVAVYGLQQTERALHALAPDVEKALNKEIRESLNVVRDLARGLVPADSPMSGWTKSGRYGWNPDVMRVGMTVGRGSARGTRGLSTISVAWQLRSNQAAATIYDKAGTKTEGSGTGVQFIRNIRAASGRKGQRLLWPAWLMHREATMKRIEEAIHRAEQKLQQAIDQADRAA